ncbi:acyl-CoA thioester hydrolase [Peribacillus deserti]|uniref:Acyl-CoA thioester hydrolase n=1 Tax=Peribacillus deserti TaxID=673318 RepID=A0ABS2QDZ7_9BACI|nr:thioesterase family protein [Peribacillus deserti]MBM7691385.1 acyl-CoA thioester hydrolase [Peribacillus deserti]
MLVSEKKIDVRYGETDQMGVVYHANYIVWMELGRTQLIQDLGFKYADMEEAGILSPVTDIQASYRKPVRYPETATVKTWIEKYDGIRVTYGYEVYNAAGELALTGFSSHVCVKAENFRPISVRKKFPDWHEAYEKNKKNEA